MKYLIRRISTMEGSNLIELPDGSIPLAIREHQETGMEWNGGVRRLVFAHWDCIYLEPFKEQP